MKIIFIFFIFSSCIYALDKSACIEQDAIEKSFELERLSDETYYFPARKNISDAYTYQILKRFDMIFVGYEDNSSTENLSYLIPGKYTHMLVYLGKDSNGFAYALEMNGVENNSLKLGIDGFSVSGHLYIYCLGSDFGKKSCPKDNYIYGIETYDFMWAKRLKHELYSKLIRHEKELLSTIKKDLITKYSTKLPIHVGAQTINSKVISLVDNTRADGGDCTSYFVSLFEEIAGVCMDNIRINAKEIQSYYKSDKIGKIARLPARYNPFSNENVYISHLLDSGYRFVDNTPRQTFCSDRRVVVGVATPNLLFNSSSLIDIECK